MRYITFTFYSFIIVILFCKCNSETIAIPQLQQSVVCNAIGINGQTIIASLSWAGELKAQSLYVPILNGSMVLWENNKEVDSFYHVANGIYKSNFKLVPGNSYSVTGIVNDLHFSSTKEYLNFPPIIDTVFTGTYSFNSKLYKFCDTSNSKNYDLYVAKSLDNSQFKLFNRFTSFYQVAENDANINTDKCFFNILQDKSFNYVGNVTPSLKKFIESIELLEGTQNAMSLNARPVFSNITGGYGIFGLFSSDSIYYENK